MVVVQCSTLAPQSSVMATNLIFLFAGIIGGLADDDDDDDALEAGHVS